MRDNKFLELDVRGKLVTVYADCRVLVFDPVLATEHGYEVLRNAPHIGVSDISLQLFDDLSDFERRVLAEREVVDLRGQLAKNIEMTRLLAVLAVSLAATLVALFLR